MSWRVCVTRRIPQAGIELLARQGFELDVYNEDNAIPEALLKKKLTDCDAVLCLLTDVISEELLDRAKKLKIIANYAVGFNNIDLTAATRKRIAVSNTPGVLTEATADCAMALLLAVCRRVVEGDQMVREGRFTGWGPMLLLGADLYGKTIGIVGAGRIGAAVAQRAGAFGLSILYAARSEKKELEEQYGARWVDLKTLLSGSDFVSLHIPLTSETRHLIDKKALEMMKPGAFLINTARGDVVKEKDLVNALQTGRLAGAGLDVFEKEPRLAPGLTDLPNVVLMPHAASATEETRSRMAIMAAQNIIDLFEKNKPRNLVNTEIWQA